jgi:hypothetical protein
MAWQNRAMFQANRPLAALAAMSVLTLPGCGREPAPTEAWLGPVVDVAAPAAAGARFPHLSAAPAGAPVVMSWLEPDSDGSRYSLRYATWQEDRRWGPATEVAAGENWFVNWADFPSVVPLDERALAAHWLQQQPGGVYSYDVMTRLSSDHGRSWSTPAAPHDDGTATEHGFVSIANWQGRPYAVWLDGRNTAEEGRGHDGHASGHGAMSLRGAALAASGAGAGSEIDGRVCDCCQTDLALARDALLVVYRDRSADEVRDIRLARLEREEWSTPVSVHADGWKIDACPVNGPAIAARGDTVVVAWFTAPDRPRVRLAFSADGGRSFAPPLEVASGAVIGRVDVVLLADGRALVSWLATAGEAAAIRVQPFTGAGPAGPAVEVATANVARSSGFPQLLEVPGGLLFAWTETRPDPAVRTAFAALR